jgi:hypothetical protein
MWIGSFAVALILASCMGLNASGATSGDMQPRLDLKALAEPLQDLTPADRLTVDKVIKLIGEKQHLQALTYLTGLTASNPKNSSLRVLRAYALLELGNITGALGDARTAEGSGTPAAYKCWFLAQVAYLAGNKPLCRREIKQLAMPRAWINCAPK